jgi:FkbM family methyltransferase
MHVFHTFRNGINWLLSPSGFAVQRTRKGRWLLPSSVVETKVGKFIIKVPGLNPMYSYYETNRNFTSQLGRLTSTVRKKYQDMTAVDIGANVGDTACLIRSAENVPVICIEGDDKSFQFLQQNIAQFEKVSAFKLFLGENNRTISADLACAGWNATILPTDSEAGSTLKLVRFDEFIMAQPGWRLCKLLKVDTEGFDCAILRGAEHFIREVSPVIFFEYNRQAMDLIGEPGIDTLFRLRDWGYSRLLFHDAKGRFAGTALLSDEDAVRDWHEYADGINSDVYYLDITAFHERDGDLAIDFLNGERSFRRTGTDLPGVKRGG